MEQPKKPGPRDITDLKARLGLNRGGAAPVSPPGAPARPPFGSPPGAQPPPPSQPPMTGAMGLPGPAAGAAPAPQAPDPYASLRPPAGRQFDLRPVDDGIPVATVRRGAFRGALIFGLIMAIFGGALGIGFGIGMSGRRAYNETNRAAKKVRVEIEEMHKTVTQIAAAVAFSSQRLQAEKKDRLSYDAKFIEDLEKIKLDPRPDTSRIFTVDYFRMPNIAVDNLMSYYYDTIALYGEVEKHVKKSRADKESLEAFAVANQKAQANYGVVFAGGGKMVVANLVEMGQPVCRDGGNECPVDQLDGFKIRSNAGANWVTRKIASKPDGSIVVPIDRTPLLESAMSGSVDQARMEQYRLRSINIQLLLTRISQTNKQLTDAIKTAASRPDMFSL